MYENKQQICPNSTPMQPSPRNFKKYEKDHGKKI